MVQWLKREDGVQNMTETHQEQSLEELENLLKQACIYGMTAENISFPCMAELQNHPVSMTAETLSKQYPKLIEGMKSSTAAAKPWNDCTNPDLKLESLFSTGVFLKDEDHDGLPDHQDFHVVLPKRCDSSIASALADLMVRFAMSCTMIESDRLGSRKDDGNLIVFENSGQPSIQWEEDHDRVILHLYGTGTKLEQFVSSFCSHFDTDPYTSMEENSWQLNQALLGRTFDGQKAFILSHDQRADYYADCSGQDLSALKQYHIRNAEDRITVMHARHQLHSERETLLQQVSASTADHSRPCVITAAVSKDRDERMNLQKQIKESYPQAEVTVINAYKPGFSWMEEVCMPQLKKLQADTVVIYFRPFLKPGETKWHDEDGAVPKRSDDPAQKEPDWLELPIRYLQELYPIDDILKEGLKISRKQITFRAMDDLDHTDATYRVEGYTGDQLVYTAEHRERTYERNYLDAFPQAGKVHPEPAWLCIEQDGKICTDVQFPTDRDQIWTLFQTETLPQVKAELLKQYPSGITAEDQPLFSRLLFTIRIPETFRQLACRNDLIAPVDALQEDLYFTALEYFKYLGKSLCGKPLTSPGLIEPDIQISLGSPVYEVDLEQPLVKHVCMKQDGITAPLSELDHSTYLSAVSFEDHQLVYHYQAEGMSAAYRNEFLDLLESGNLQLCKTLSMQGRIVFNDSASALIPKQEEPHHCSIDEIDLHESEVIGYDLLETIMAQLKQVPGLRVLSLSRSYQGRTVYGIAFDSLKKGVYSRAKALTRKPSVIVNCRHHANEVSSTNSALMLVKKLLSDPEYCRIAEQMNLMIIPMENPDGAAIHDHLQQYNPYNKLHVARYNALGNEFFREVFSQNTIQTEAHAVFRLYRDLLPDVFIDDHGVPSHEWEQPYSGYTSPSFKGFWLPRSILYGYFWYPMDEAYESNQLMCHAIEDTVADAVNQDDWMTAENREWQDRFETYAHAWLPRLFPADYYKGMINYWIGRNQSFDQIYFSHRLPWITTVYYTSEVADETAQGAYLHRCAETHLKEDLAILTLIEHACSAYNTCYVESDKGIRIGIQRVRPLYPGNR